MDWPFDPMKERADCAELRNGRWRATDQARERAGRVRTSVLLTDVAFLLLTGLPRVAAELAAEALRRRDLLDQPVMAQGSDAAYLEYFQQATETRALRTAILFRWVAEGTLERSTLARVLDWYDRTLAAERSFTRERRDPLDLDQYLLDAVMARQDERGLALYRAEDKDRLAPLVAARAKSGRKVGALIAQERLAGGVSPQTRRALDGLIAAKLKEWLTWPRPELLLSWLLVRDDLAGVERSPGELALSAYEFMPDVPRPPMEE